MGTLGLEAVLIGQVLNAVGLTIVTDIGIGSADNNSFVIGAHVLQLAFLLMRLSVARLHAKENQKPVSKRP